MKFPSSISIQSLCQIFDLKFIGDPEFQVLGINEIHRVEIGDVVFVDNKKYYDKALHSKASVVIIDKEVVCPKNKVLIIHDQPFEIFNRIIVHFSDLNLIKNKGQEIHPSARIASNVSIGENVKIGEGCIVHHGAVIGNNVELRKNVIIGPNTVIGHYAFYYKSNHGAHHRMITCGGVQIMDNVEIGALCSVDSGVTHHTIIGEGTKIDNQVQVGHDVHIGKHCLFASGVGIAGCVNIEDNVTLWGQVGVASGITIEKNAVVLAQSGVSKSLAGGKTYFGSPCQEAKQTFKEMATLRALTVKGV